MSAGDQIVWTHLDRMTDSTGLVQHAIYSVPRRDSGYTTDDNARALRLCARLWCEHPGSDLLNRISCFLSFLEYARGPSGRLHNLLSYQRHWLETQGTDDCQGQAVRALAEVLGSELPDGYRALARELIDGLMPTLTDLRSIRAQAYVIMAYEHLWRAGVEDTARLEAVARSSAQRLADCYRRTAREHWRWFELRMTYANAVLPHALFLAAPRWPKEGFLEVAMASFDLLDRETTAGEVFWPVGNGGWYPAGEEKAPYDQQPVEAATMADASLAAFGLLGDEKYRSAFHRARAWFHGGNSLGQPLIDAAAGACCDGLHFFGLNRNQGAESTLAYLWTEVLSGHMEDVSTRGPGCLKPPAAIQEFTQEPYKQGNRDASRVQSA